MVAKRNIGVSILLSIVTCGIYMLYWYYTILKDLYTLNGEQSKAEMDLVLNIITCGIYGMYMMYKSGERTDNIRAKYGVPAKSQGILFLILSIFGLSIVVFAILQSEINDELSNYGSSGSQWS